MCFSVKLYTYLFVKSLLIFFLMCTLFIIFFLMCILFIKIFIIVRKITVVETFCKVVSGVCPKVSFRIRDGITVCTLPHVLIWVHVLLMLQKLFHTIKTFRGWALHSTKLSVMISWLFNFLDILLLSGSESFIHLVLSLLRWHLTEHGGCLFIHRFCHMLRTQRFRNRHFNRE